MTIRCAQWENSKASVPANAPPLHHAPLAVGQLAFAALADNVRDYAIFLMNPEGVILFWGEGARLMKWWLVEEAEGAHLRLLYPDGGAEDGTCRCRQRRHDRATSPK